MCGGEYCVRCVTCVGVRCVCETCVGVRCVCEVCDMCGGEVCG